MIKVILKNLKSKDKELHMTTLQKLFAYPISCLYEHTEKFVEIYNSNNLSPYANKILADIIVKLFKRSDPRKSLEYRMRGNLLKIDYSCFYEHYFSRYLLKYIAECRENKIVLAKDDIEKNKMRSIIFFLAQRAMNDFDLDDTICCLGVLNGLNILPLIINEEKRLYNALRYIEPAINDKYVHDSILNTCLTNRDFTSFIIYFIRFGRNISLYNEEGNHIYQDAQKNIRSSTSFSKKVYDEEKKGIRLEDFDLCSFTATYQGFQEFFDKSIDEFIKNSKIKENDFDDIVNIESKNLFEDLTNIDRFTKMENFYEDHVKISEQIITQKFKPFNFRNIRFSIILDYVFRNCTYYEFMQIIFIVNKAKVMMFDYEYIRKIVGYRRESGLNGNCMNCCENTVCNTIESWDKMYGNTDSATLKNNIYYEQNMNITESEQQNTNSKKICSNQIHVCVGCYTSTSRGVLQNLWNYDTLCKILNDRFVPTVNQILFKTIDWKTPLKINSYLNASNKSKVLFNDKDLPILALINGFLNFGFTYDDFFCSDRFPIDFENIILDDNTDFITLFGSIGMLRKNENERFSISQFLDDSLSFEKKNLMLDESQNTNHNIFLESEIIEYRPTASETSRIKSINKYFDGLIKIKEFSNKKLGLILAFAISETIYGDSFDFLNQKTILSERIDAKTTDFSKYNENTLKMKFGDNSEIYGSDNYGGKNADLICNEIFKCLVCCDSYQVVACMAALHMLYCDTKIKKTSLINILMKLMLYKDVITSSFALFTLGSIYNGGVNGGKIDVYAIFWFSFWQLEFPISPFFALGALGISLFFMGRHDLAQKDTNKLKPDHIDFLCTGMGFIGTGDCQVLSELSDVYKNIKRDNAYVFDRTKLEEILKKRSFTEDINLEAKTTSKKNKNVDIDLVEKDIYKNTMLSLCLLSITMVGIGNHLSRDNVTQLLFKIAVGDKTDFIPLCLAILYASEPVLDIIDYIYDFSKNSNDPTNTILALGIIGAGTKNPRIIDYLKSFEKNTRNKNIENLLKISLSLCNLGNGTLSLSPTIYEGSIINKKSLISLLCVVCLFINKYYNPIIEDYNFLFLLLSGAVRNKYVCVFDSNLQIKAEQIVVEKLSNDFIRKETDEKTFEAITCVEANEKANVYKEKYKPALDVFVLKDIKK
ncbi:hypothetical protein EDEG_04054, partial [Edhazardia aedis USNM 41457]